jgi:hypothetical protein
VNTLRFYLWKEWREHRLALLAVALISATMMCGFARFFAQQRILQDPMFPGVSCVVVVLIALLAVGGELLAERHADGLTWLRRLPAGLPTPFWAKLAFHGATTLAAGFFGLALAFAAAWMRGAAQEGPDANLALAVLFLIALFALWTFASSSWSSRSALALFSAAFVLAGLGSPVWYLTSRGYQPDSWELTAGALLLLAGALPSAWLGFVTAGRFGRGSRLGSGLGVAAAVVSFAPFWAWGLFQLHQRDRMDPQLEDFQVLSAGVTSDGRTAFVEARVWSERWEVEALPHAVLRVDLSSGEFESLGRGKVTQYWMASPDCHPYRVIELRSERGVTWLDADSGRAVPEDVRVSPLHRCPNLRGWIGPVRQTDRITDSITGKTVRPSELDLPSDAWILTNRGAWFVVCESGSAFTLDPDSNRLERAEWLDPASWWFGPSLPDGRFFVPLRSGGIGLVDSVRQEVRQLDATEDSAVILRPWSGFQIPFTDDDAVVLWTGARLYQFDRINETLQPLPIFPHHLKGVASIGNELYAIDQDRIVRYTLPNLEKTVLFPR